MADVPGVTWQHAASTGYDAPDAEHSGHDHSAENLSYEEDESGWNANRLDRYVWGEGDDALEEESALTAGAPG